MKFGKGKIKRRRFKIKKYIIIFMSITMFTFYGLNKLAIAFEEKIEPYIMATSEVYLNRAIEAILYNAILDAMKTKKFSVEDFFTYDVDSEGYVTFFSVNNLLINELTTYIRANLYEQLGSGEEKFFAVPVGEILFSDYFSDFSFDYKFGVIPIGYTNVNYYTDFQTMGVNQTKLSVYIVADATVRIVNPLVENEIKVSKSIVIFDSIINGKVPSGMMISTEE